MGLMDKARDFLNSESGKQKTGKFLDKAERFATDKLGADKADKIGKARDAAEGRLGATGTDDAVPPSMERPEEPGIADGKGRDAPGAAGGEGNPRP